MSTWRWFGIRHQYQPDPAGGRRTCERRTTAQLRAREEAPREAAGLVAAAAAQDEAVSLKANVSDEPLPETALSHAPMDAGTGVASRHGDTKLQTTLFGEQRTCGCSPRVSVCVAACGTR